MSKPKAILFDIGGVCVISPLQAIADYEEKNGIPKDYINFAISRSGSDGAWSQLERGIVEMDSAFFERFQQDVNNPQYWQEYHASFKNRKQKSLKQLAGAAATQLGDPISLKAETSKTNPTPDEAGAPQSSRPGRRGQLKDSANRSMLGDPTSLKTETNDKSPLPDDSGAPPARAPATGYGSSPPRNSKMDSYRKNMLGDPTSLVNEGSSSTPVPADSQATGYDKASTPSVASSSSNSGNSLRESYKKNMLGDPTSLKNEGSSSEPIPEEEGAQSSRSSSSNKFDSGSTGNSMKDSYKKNMLGDPTSLKNEGSSSNPLVKDEATGYPKMSSTTLAPPTKPSPKSTSSGNSLAQSYKKNMLGDPTSLKNEGSDSEPLPDQQDTGYTKSASAPTPSTPGVPSMPKIDMTTVFWHMMDISRTPDPHMFPALLNLRKSKQFLVGALSNTVIFPADHPYSKAPADESQDVRKQFDVFVSSAHVGMRKPDPRIYRLAVAKLDRYDRGHGGDGVRADQIVFLDDIGTNLKAAREVGMHTLKVDLGRTDDAVRELERLTGLKLAGEKAKL